MGAVIRVWAAIAAAVLVLVLVLGAGSAWAGTPSPGWTIDSFAAPTNFTEKDNAVCFEQITESVLVPSCDAYTTTARNAGSVSSDGTEATLSAPVPNGA